MSNRLDLDALNSYIQYMNSQPLLIVKEFILPINPNITFKGFIDTDCILLEKNNKTYTYTTNIIEGTLDVVDFTKGYSELYIRVVKLFINTHWINIDLDNLKLGIHLQYILI